MNIYKNDGHLHLVGEDLDSQLSCTRNNTKMIPGPGQGSLFSTPTSLVSTTKFSRTHSVPGGNNKVLTQGLTSLVSTTKSLRRHFRPWCRQPCPDEDTHITDVYTHVPGVNTHASDVDTLVPDVYTPQTIVTLIYIILFCLLFVHLCIRIKSMIVYHSLLCQNHS